MKRGECILLILVMALCTANAAAEPTVKFGPTEVYETNDISFALNISNYQNSYEITKVQAELQGLEVLAMVDYHGWTETYNSSTASWTEGSLGTNIMLALFELLAEAPLVYENQQTETTITLTDGEDGRHEFLFDITILNDETPPQLTDIVPQDGDHVKEGTTDQPVRANATDPETGIDNVQISWVLCEPEGNETPQEHSEQLAPEEGLYQAGIDLSEYEDEQQVCFSITAQNNGGESSEYEGTLTVDGVPPSVSLVSPDDGAIVGLAQDFTFLAEDNLAPTMTCSMDIDGAEYMTDIEAESMEVTSIPGADLEEGQHTWSIRCADPAGWEGQSETWTYDLDKTPPRIQMTAPENDSIIADSMDLEFEVTDNYQLEKVWFVRDGNETEMEGEFNISVAGWPEGPSEFAVIAEDSVGNQAEQTYQLTVDRTPPQVEPVSPAENATSDVHANLTYSVLDNYDDAMDCTVYIDDEPREQHTAQQGENSRSEILAIGEHRWKVQCVDDAGNTGESDERSLNVVDTSGPDIVMDNTDTVYRGDPVEISLEVTDISGVEDVSAELRDPDDNTQSVPLETEEEDMYTASIETHMNSTLGVYTLTVYAVDTLNNSNTAEDNILVTYRYVVALELDPATAEPDSTVTATGEVTFDNGTGVPEDSIVLALPGNQTQNVTLEGTGFSHDFTAPSEEGAYDVQASITSAQNSQQYSTTEQLTVQEQQGGAGHGSGGGSGGGSGRTRIDDGDDGDSCTTDWGCTAWSSCSDGEQERTCIDMSGCSTDDARRVETRSCTEEQEQEEDQDDDTGGQGTTVNDTREPLPGPEKHEIDATQEDTGDAAGIGKASGFMSALDVSLVNVIFALVLMTVIMGTLYKYGWSKGDGRKKPAAVDYLSTKGDKLGLEDYLEQRSRRR